VALKPAQDFPLLGGRRIRVYREDIGLVAALGVDDVERLVSDDLIEDDTQDGASFFPGRRR
jgi:hypothetical protein